MLYKKKLIDKKNKILGVNNNNENKNSFDKIYYFKKDNFKIKKNLKNKLSKNFTNFNDFKVKILEKLNYEIISEKKKNFSFIKKNNNSPNNFFINQFLNENLKKKKKNYCKNKKKKKVRYINNLKKNLLKKINNKNEKKKNK